MTERNGELVQSRIEFIVTGFGPFQGVRNNPTQLIVGELVDYLKAHRSIGVACLSPRIRVHRLETSVQSVVATLNQIYEEMEATNAEQSNKSTIVLLHLGVNYQGTDFQLERCAYNDATFRVPDEQGYQPQQVCIANHCELGTCLTTRLDLADLAGYVNANCMIEPTRVESISAEPFIASCDVIYHRESSGMLQPARAIESIDPGRFVCNYTYFYSLDKFQSHNQRNDASSTSNSCFSLFVHVPPFQVAPKEAQLEVVAQIMAGINEQLSK